MEGIAELDAALQDQKVDIQKVADGVSATATLSQKISDDVAALAAEIASGTTPVDLTQRVDALKANNQTLSDAADQLQTIATQMKNTDTVANPPAPTTPAA